MKKKKSLFRPQAAVQNTFFQLIVLAVVAVITGAVIQSVFFSQHSFSFFAPKKEESELVSLQKEAENLKRICGSSKRGEFCYANMFEKVTKEGTLAHSISLLSEVARIDPGARGCHLIAHSIAIAETQKDPSKWQDIISQVPMAECTGGYIHGVVETKQAADENFVISSQTIPEFCEIVKKNNDSPGSDQNCSHIMGHLSLVVAEGSIDKANEICGGIPENMQFECHSGIYMENETRENLIAHSVNQRIPWNKDTTGEQQRLCENATGIAQIACWREISHMFVFISKDYPPEVYKLCNQAPATEAAMHCYQHGVGIMTANSGFDTRNMKVLCEPFEESRDEYSRCYSMAIGSMLTSSPHFSERVTKLCNAVLPVHTRGCFEYFGNMLSRIVPPEKLASHCATVPLSYKALCMGRLGSGNS